MLKKAGISDAAKQHTTMDMKDKLSSAYQEYWALRKNHRELRITFLESFADALAEQNNLQQEKVLAQLKERESQRSVARKIRFLQGKLKSGSMTMVTTEAENDEPQEITAKTAMEEAILHSNAEKFQQVQQNPFYRQPLSLEIGPKGTGPISASILSGVFDSNYTIPTNAKVLLEGLQRSSQIQEMGPINMDLSLPAYRHSWKKAKENTSCYPDTLSFLTMKVGASSDIISSIDHALVPFPLKSVTHPSDGKSSWM
jgi:hypothetical protein